MVHTGISRSPLITVNELLHLQITQAQEMHELLQELEFCTSFYNSNPVCPCCLSGAEVGHESDCKLDAILKAVEKECQPPSTTD